VHERWTPDIKIASEAQKVEIRIKGRNAVVYTGTKAYHIPHTLKTKMMAWCIMTSISFFGLLCGDTLKHLSTQASRGFTGHLEEVRRT
jgi:hypothetical protein